jgi:hypothetical protein
VIWQNLWAFAGLLALAIPVAIHLLGRRTARVRRFPTLRFVAASNPLSTRRTRPTDIPLLIARLGILTAAVGALARPLFVTADRERDLGRALTRAIVVDTSASMRRRAPQASGERALDVALRRAGELAAEASSSVVIATTAPADALPGAVAWLTSKTARREVVIVSDFQGGTIDRGDLDAIAADIGIELARIDVARDSAIEAPALVAGVPGVARVTPTLDGVSVEWSRRGPSVPAAGEPVILAGAAEVAGADAARGAALSTLSGRAAPERPIAIVYRGFDARGDLLREAKPIDSPWQGDVLARLRADSALVAVAGSADVAVDPAFDASNRAAFTVVARSAAGVPLVFGASGPVTGRDRLLLFFQGDAASLASATLIAAAVEATSATVPAVEMDPLTTPEATLAEWRRPAARATLRHAGGESGESDGRWFWVAALVLLAIETWMRRPRRDVPSVEAVSERAA